MITLFKMAIRDLGRNRRRTFFSALALGMGLALLLLMASVIQGEINGSMETEIKLQSGHLQVRAITYDETKTSLKWEDLVENPDRVAAQISSLAPVKLATPRLFATGIVTAGEDSVGVRIIGVDPTSPANDPFRNGMVSGDFLTTDDRSGILIGEPLAKKLSLKPGDAINLLVNTANGSVDQQNFTVQGIFSTHTPIYDEGTVFLPIAKAQAITQAQNHASTIFVLLNDKNQADAVAGALKSDKFQTIPWQKANEILLTTEKLFNAYMVVLYMIVLAITATVIVNTLIMSVFERTREIGILAAIGLKGWRIMVMFFMESSLLGIGGIILGWILGGLLVYYGTVHGFYIGNMGVSGFTLGDTIFAQWTLKNTITLSITAFIVTLLAGLYPAILAARMEPVEALHAAK